MAVGLHDYVVIGGGSSGSVVAARLAEAGADVLVLEAGGSDRRPDVLIPAGVISAYRTLNWKYVPEPDPSRNDVVEAWAAGRVLGGGGSINATVFVRGHPGDYDGWAAAGCDGWDYASVLPRFRRLESWFRGADEFRGARGPIAVGFHSIDHLANDAFLAAAQEAGHEFTPDYNGARQEGVGIVQVNQRRGVRSQASREYRRRVARGHHLTIRTKAFVHRIVIEHGRAVGVEYEHRGERKLARAREEVVLSGGALASPKILMLSGVGPARELEACGVDVVHDLDGVGQNLQEHPAAMQRWHANFRTINKMRARDVAKAVADYARHGRGLLAATVFHVQVMHRTDPASPTPDVQLAFANFATTRERGPDGILKVGPHEDEGVLVSTLYLHPRSRGCIRLRSADPLAPPVIAHELLGSPEDVHGMVAGMREGRRIMEQPAIADLVGGMFEPEGSCRTDADWEAHLRENATYGAHPVGTCRMGVDEGSVVDPRLRVHGIERLRVVDASIMPTLTTGNTNAPSMMIGEMAADLVLNRTEVSEEARS